MQVNSIQIDIDIKCKKMTIITTPGELLAIIWNTLSLTPFQRVEEIKNKRQAHHIFQRMKMAKKIQKAKDIKEVI